MLKSVARRGEVLLCGTCMDARGLTNEELAEGAQRSTMDELAARTIAADRVLVFSCGESEVRYISAWLC